MHAAEGCAAHWTALTQRDVLIDVCPQVCLEASKLLFAVVRELLACRRTTVSIVSQLYQLHASHALLAWLTLYVALLLLRSLLCEALGDTQLPRDDLATEELYVSSAQACMETDCESAVLARRR